MKTTIITGHYGSGKSEFALNYARKENKIYDNVHLADMDIVNPYFRVRDKEGELEREGIKCIYSHIRGHGVDLPAINGLNGYINTTNLIVDLGGDGVGAKVMNRFDVDGVDKEVLFVINTYRPETNSIDKIISKIRDIEKQLSLRVDGLINNSNLLWDTDINHLLESQGIIREVGKVLGIETRYINIFEDKVDDLCRSLPEDEKSKVFPLKIYNRQSWM